VSGDGQANIANQQNNIQGALAQDEGKRCEAHRLQKQKARFWRENGWW